LSIRAAPTEQAPAAALQQPGGRARSAAASLIGACHEESVALLARNGLPEGVLAATAGERARERSYTAIFGRDAAICALGMALCGDSALTSLALKGLQTLAAHQASNGQIPKFVGLDPPEADFWYLGCIDATLWWLIALAFLESRGAAPPQARQGRAVRLALQWLESQQHPRLQLLQQNEASDWADIMPRSGFVLYTNALWHLVKRIHGLPGAEQTRRCCNSLLHPFSGSVPGYRRERLMAEYAARHAKDRSLYLSFINFMSFGDEGDVLGNLLAILCGLTTPSSGRRLLQALEQACVHEPYPVRAVVRPIRPGSALWRPYMARHRQNLPWQYHNGGIWPMIGGFWVAALVACGRRRQAQEELLKLAQSCQLGGWAFNEWLQGRTGALRGMPGQSWNAAAFLMAQAAVADGESPFAPFLQR
jgi:hypothetical protein